MNKLIVIGWMGDQVAYLNITRDEAIQRYITCEGSYAKENFDSSWVREIDFEEEFCVYDAWEKK